MHRYNPRQAGSLAVSAGIISRDGRTGGRLPSHENEFAVLDDPIFNKIREFDHMFMSSEDFGRILEERTEMDLRSAFGRGRNVGLAEGEARGKANGIAENQRKTALTMLKDGLSLDVIAKYTGLKRDDVAALQAQMS